MVICLITEERQADFNDRASHSTCKPAFTDKLTVTSSPKHRIQASRHTLHSGKAAEQTDKSKAKQETTIAKLETTIAKPETITANLEITDANPEIIFTIVAMTFTGKEMTSTDKGMTSTDKGMTITTIEMTMTDKGMVSIIRAMVWTEHTSIAMPAQHRPDSTVTDGGCEPVRQHPNKVKNGRHKALHNACDSRDRGILGAQTVKLL